MTPTVTTRGIAGHPMERRWVSYRVETDTHVADLSMPVFSQAEFAAGVARGQRLLGMWVKPHVRVKMGRRSFFEEAAC